jgi:hypothetical protein
MRMLMPAAFAANSKNELSRRSFITSVVAAAPVVLLASSASYAQGDVWRDYRRDDLGFRIEMPGKPKVEDKVDEFKDIWLRTVEAEVEYEDMTFGVQWNEWKQPLPAEEGFNTWREGMRLGGMPVTRERTFLMNGFPAREFIREAEDINYVRREVVAGNLTINAGVMGERTMHRNPAVSRYLDSFTLLRSAR